MQGDKSVGELGGWGRTGGRARREGARERKTGSCFASVPPIALLFSVKDKNCSFFPLGSPDRSFCAWRGGIVPSAQKLRIASFAEQLVNLEPYAASQRRFQELLAAAELNARMGLEPVSARGERPIEGVGKTRGRSMGAAIVRFSLGGRHEANALQFLAP